MRFGKMLRIAAATLALAVPRFAAADDATPPPDPDLGTNIISAEAQDGALFALGEGQDMSRSGTLVSFRLADGARTVRLKAVVGIHKAGGHLWAFAKSDRAQLYRLLEWRNGDFVQVSTVPIGWAFAPLALTDIAGHPAVVTNRAVKWFDGTIWHNVAFQGDLGWGFASSGAPASGGFLYVGLNRGEWGGGLLRIDLATGMIESIVNSKPAAGNFASVLDPGLDPVQAIIPDPASPDCVIVAIGLIHFESSGRIDRVCGATASIVFDPSTPRQFPGGLFNVEQAFFGLVPAASGYWAVSNEGVYRFGVAPEPKLMKFFGFEEWHGLVVSRGVPGTLILVTEVNRHFSLNGGTPLIVTLD